MRIASALLFAGGCLAWVGNSPHIDLTWPPPDVKEDAVVDGKPVIDLSPLDARDLFPCALNPIPSDVPRIDFPIFGGKIQLNLTRPDPSQVIENTTWWMIDVSIGQFNNDMTISLYSYVMMVDDWSWHSTDFEPGTWCPTYDKYSVWNITDKVVGRGMPDNNPLPHGTDLEGVNATLGLTIVRFGGPLHDDNEAEMHQCAYVRLTSTPSSLGACFPSNTPSTTSAPTRTARPTSTSTTSSATPAAAGSHHALAIGVGVGVTAGVAIILIIVGLIVIRKRRGARVAKNPQPMPPSGDDAVVLKSIGKGKEKVDVPEHSSKDTNEAKDDIIVSKSKEEDHAISKAKEMDDTSVTGESSRASVHSEQLPSYADATEKEMNKKLPPQPEDEQE